MIGLDLTDKIIMILKKLEFRQHSFILELRDPSKSHVDLNNIEKKTYVRAPQIMFILSCQLCLGLTTDLFPSCFPD
jgi:hypothetical protein